MPQWIQLLSGSEDTIEAVLVPGSWFVTRSFAVPEGLKGKEIEEFAELSVEEISPFNLEQLNWGYFFSEASRRVFIYAAYDQKLRPFMAESELYDYAFPDFSQTFGLKFARPTLIFLIHEATLCGILLPANDPVPQTVVGITRDPESTVEDLDLAKLRITQRIRSQLARLPESTLANPVADFGEVEVSDQIYTRDGEFKASNADAAIGLVPYNGESGTPWQVAIPHSTTLWEMDIRKADSKELLFKRHGWNLWFWRASVAVILLFLVLALAEFGLAGLGKWNERKLQVAMRNQPLAEAVQQKADMLAKIEQITTNQLLPFEMLDAVNQLRPSTIYFTRFTAEGTNTLQVEAISTDIASISGYERSLREEPFVRAVEISNNRVANNTATFRLRVEFKQGALQPQTFLTDL